MKNTLFYILSVGIAFYAGSKVLTKTVVKKVEVKVKDPVCISIEQTLHIVGNSYDSCLQTVKEKEEEIEHKEHELKKIDSDLEICESRYREEYEKVLHPEEQKPEEPKMMEDQGEYYEEYR